MKARWRSETSAGPRSGPRFRFRWYRTSTTIGVLALDSRKPGAYSKRDLDIAQHIGGQIAAAVVNAQLHIKQKRAEIANVVA